MPLFVAKYTKSFPEGLWTGKIFPEYVNSGKNIFSLTGFRLKMFNFADEIIY